MHPRIDGHVVLATVREASDELLLRTRRRSDGAMVLVKTHAAERIDVRTLARYRHAIELAHRYEALRVCPPLELVEMPDRAALSCLQGEFALLADRTRPQPMSLPELLPLAVALVEALDAIHQAGWLHGDVRPSSVLVEHDPPRAMFLDLQWARPLAQPAVDVGAAAESMLPYLAPEQTGRIARAADQRADIYSLGATFFELLCGRPPFLADDPLELVHSHIAEVAPSVHALRPELPPVIGEIVGRMLAKSPDDRYQSCAGLRADLLRCAAHTDRGEPIPAFELGREDAGAQLELPRKLYGREAERAHILERFACAADGEAALLVVAGPPGVGKSALIADVEPRMTEAGGIFVSGKFDQLLVNAPYSAVKQAFGDLVRRLLGEREEQIRYWRGRLLEAAGTQGRILIELLPDLERIIGPQPAVEVLGPVEAHQRFSMVFGRFVRAFAQVEHPLVVFLDDWQWADAASAGLIQDVASAPDAGALLLILAYRSSELASSHPAHAAIERLKAAGMPTTSLALPPLGLPELERFVADALRCPDDHARALAENIATRTGGNPFFARSFLQMLHETGGMHPDRDGGWRCDLTRLGSNTAGETVLDLVAARLGRLPRETRALVELAACLGSEFRIGDLATAAGRDEASVAGALAGAVDAALLTRGVAAYRFVHDRVQEAAYTCVAAEDRPRLHLTIGRRLLEQRRRTGGTEPIAQAVEQLNAGRSLVVDAHERRELAELNLRVGQRAREATAYASAARHAAVGIELLGPDGWSAAYELALDLHALRAESEYLSGQFAIAEELYEVALRHARTDHDRIRILTIKKDQYELQGRYPDAILVLREGLVLVGIDLPDSDEELRALLDAELRQVPGNLAGRPIASLIDAPEITDPRRIATLQLLMGLWPSCYVAGRQRLLTVVSLKIANFCLVHGNCEVTSAAYVNYSFVAGFVTGDYATAYEFGRLGIALSERYANRAIRSWCYFLFGCGTAIWRRPLPECAPYLERSFQLGLESGSLASACYAASYIVTDAFFRGSDLAQVDTLYTRYRDFLARSNPAIHMYMELGIHSMHRLVGREPFGDPAVVAALEQNPFFMASHAFGQLAAAYHLDEPERASACADAAAASVPELLSGIYKVPETAMYAALAWLAALDRAPAAERARMRTAAEQQLALLEQLARECEDSFLHKALLVRGELAHVEGRTDEAVALLDRAAEAAARAGFQQNAALAHELAARVWRERGFPKAARAYLREAYDGYRAWGATAKLGVLEARYPDLLGPPGSAPLAPWPGASPAPLDLLSVTKASQAISREIELDALLARLMHVMIENAGARRGALILVEADRLQVLASAEGLEVAVGAAVPGDAAARVTESIVRYVARTGETVLLDDAASHGRFARDPQVRRRGCRSVICLPLRLKDHVVGALYLENELSAGAFTPTRKVVLELLAGQAAISLENARLYSDLKAAILRQDEARAVAEAANRAKDDFLAMLGHELRNPLAPVLTACHLMSIRGPEHFEREREVIERQVRHMTRLIDDLLDVARIARGKIELVRKPIDLSDVVRDAIELVSPLIERQRTPLEVRMPDGPVPVHGDAMRLTQVVSNVVTNAVKFSEPGSPVSIVLELEGDRALLCVVDRGAGIPADLLPRIFDLFVQGSQPRDRRMGGLGLGLSIARDLVALHGGTITAHSDGPGRGAELRIQLPIDASALAASEARATTTPGPYTPARRVLIVDDNVDAALLLVDLLETMGHTTLVAHDGPSALAKLSEFRPDVAILDIGLPVMDGFEVARQIRGQLGTAAPRLIALSGYAAPTSAHHQVFDEYLVKPVAIELLERSIS